MKTYKKASYKNAKIYRLTSSYTDDIYYGSTTNKLEYRRTAHIISFKRYGVGKGQYYSALQISKWPDVKIELVEEYPCKNRKELGKREKYYILNNSCCNKNITGNTKKESNYKYHQSEKGRATIKKLVEKYENDERYKEMKKEYIRKYSQTDKFKETQKIYRKKYLKTANGKAAHARAMKKYNSSPERKKILHEYYLRNKDKFNQKK